VFAVVSSAAPGIFCGARGPEGIRAQAREGGKGEGCHTGAARFAEAKTVEKMVNASTR